MNTYDYSDFVNSVRYFDYEDIVRSAKKRKQDLEKVKNIPNKKEANILMKKIEGVLRWLKTGRKPQPLSQTEFFQLKPICENLVSKNQLSAECLKLFETAAAV